MSGLRARSIRLERHVPTGLEAELRALTDEELVTRIAQISGVSAEQVRGWTGKERQQIEDELLAAMTEADELD